MASINRERPHSFLRCNRIGKKPDYDHGLGRRESITERSKTLGCSFDDSWVVTFNSNSLAEGNEFLCESNGQAPLQRVRALLYVERYNT